MKTMQDISEIFIKLEKDAGLFDYKYNGIPVWWFARGKILLSILEQQRKVNLSSNGAERLSLKEKIFKTIDAIICSHPNHSADVLCLSSIADRNDIFEGKMFNIFFDTITWTDYKDRYAILETTGKRERAKNPYTKKIIRGDYISLLGNIYRQLSKYQHINTIDKRKLAPFVKLVHDCLQNCGLLIDAQLLYFLIAKEIAFAQHTIDLSHVMLRKIKPKMLLVGCGYAPTHMVVQYAAKKMGIPVIEVQHGLIVPYSYGYFFGINDLEQLRDSPFPNKIIVYGNHFRRILLDNSALCEHNVEVLGYPYLWHKIKQSRGVFPSSKSDILFTPQPHNTRSLLEIARAIKQSTPNKVLFKLHPSNLTIRGTTYCNDIDIVPPSCSLYDLFINNAEFHISSSSMAHLEAIAFDVKDIIFDTHSGLEDYYRFLINLGIPIIDNIDKLEGLLSHYPDTHIASSYVKNEVFSLNINPISAYNSFFSRYI